MTVDSIGLTINGYAAHRKKLDLPGGSPWSVKKALRDGRITRNEHGKIDPEVADRQWEENTDPALVTDHREKARIAKARIEARKAGTTGQAEVPPYAQSRAVKEAYQARISRLQYEEMRGRLVDVDAVKQEAFRRARVVRDQILAVPDRVASMVAAEGDEKKVRAMLEDELRLALEALSHV